MAFIIQNENPIIKFYSWQTKNICYQEFSKYSNHFSGKNLQSYNFQKSINNISGEFQLSVKEDVDDYSFDNSFYNKVSTLDVVTISENGINIDFIGIIINKSISSTANGFSKVINISGKSIDYLFEYMSISLDATAMAWTKTNINTEIANIEAKLSNRNGNDFSKAVKVKDALKCYFDVFVQVAKDHSKLSNTAIINMINDWYGEDMFEVIGDIEFLYPISSNMFTDGTCQFTSYMRNLLPSNIYEFYGIIKDNKPKLLVRQVPFDRDKWIELNKFNIDSDYLTQYTLTQSIEEVYTAFYSYIEGSSISPEFQEKLNAILMGKNSESLKASLLLDKISKYGYKPLKCNFIGFRREVATKVEDELLNKINILNSQIADWYGELDTMYDATISIVKNQSDKVNHIDIGERVGFIGGQFYVTGIEHSWRYEQPISITLHCERGGEYDSAGNYYELQNITSPWGELK